MKNVKKKIDINHEPSSLQMKGLDKMLFIVVSCLLVLICTMLTANLYLQWSNYNQGIESALLEKHNQPQAVITYSRAMDFAFTKTSTIFIGFILVFVGTLYLLRLNEVAYSLGINNGDKSVSFQTASPGLVLVTLGVITVLITSYNKSYISFQPINTPVVNTPTSSSSDIDDLISA